MSDSVNTLSYFSLADRQMESLVPADDTFKVALYEHILFYRRKLLIPDIFFFISTPLARHVLQEGRSKSFLGACISHGLTVPALRAGGSFEASLAEIRRLGIQGRQPDDICDKVMASLQVAQESGKQFRAVTWPEQQLGTMFENELRTQLYSTDTAPQVLKGAGITQAELNDLWASTESLRTRCLDEAAKFTREAGGSGVRRGEILNAVAREIGYPGNKVHDIKELFDFAENPRRRKELESYMLWINLCYHKIQAAGFGCALSFPRFDGISAVAGDDLLPKATSDSGDFQIQEIVETVDFPHPDLLQNANVEEVLSIRKDEGAEYFERLVQWENNPNADLAQGVRVALRHYSERLRIIASRRGNVPIEKKIIRHIHATETTKEVIGIWTQAILETVRAWVEIPARLTGLAQFSKASSMTKSLTTLRTKPITISHTTRRSAEITTSVSIQCS